MAKPDVKTVFCRACGRTAEIARSQSDGRPWGWYFITVHVPPGYNKTTGKTYLVVGLFCCVACIEKGLQRMRDEEAKHVHAFEHE